jgi:hypothetical protein
MKIFISWSGESSHKSAIVLRDWLKCVLNEVEPWVSSEDIRKGKRWLVEISRELQESSFGIICLNRSNLASPWILFEAGALSKFSDARVCALLLGDLESSEVSGPISHFQATPFRKDQVRKLVSDINVLLGDKKLKDELVGRVFEKWWPDLERDIAACVTAGEPAKVSRPSESILAEILELARYTAKNLGSVDVRTLRSHMDGEDGETLIRLDSYGSVTSPARGEWNHPVSLVLSPFPSDTAGRFDQITISHRGIEKKDLGEKAETRGIEIELFFFCEEGHFWSVSFRFHKGRTYGKTRMISDDEAERTKLENRTMWRD